MLCSSAHGILEHQLTITRLTLLISLYNPHLFRLGMIVLVLICLLSVTLTVSMKRFQLEQLVCKDSRLSKIVEAVSHLKIIKLHVWEEPFLSQVDDLRRQELASIRKFLTLQALQNFIWNCAVFLVAFTRHVFWRDHQNLGICLGIKHRSCLYFS